MGLLFKSEDMGFGYVPHINKPPGKRNHPSQILDHDALESLTALIDSLSFAVSRSNNNKWLLVLNLDGLKQLAATRLTLITTNCIFLSSGSSWMKSQAVFSARVLL